MADSQSPRVAVLGAGAVGAHLGALLAQKGIDVTLIGRPRVLDAMATGVTIQRPGRGSFTAHPNVVTDGRDLGRFDVLLLTVKAYAVPTILDQVDELLDINGVIVAMQNGVGSDTYLIDRFGPDRLVAASSTISVGIDEPGVITQYTKGGLAWSSSSLATAAAVPLLRSSGLPVNQVARRDSLRWSKLLLNAVGSAVCAILQMNFGELVADPRLFGIEQKAFQERLAVLSAAGVPVVDLPAYRVRMAGFLMGLPLWIARRALGPRMARGRGGKLPTLAQDVARGGPTENLYLHGATVQLGADVGVATPVNEALSNLVDAATRDSAVRGRFHSRPDELIAELKRSGVPV